MSLVKGTLLGQYEILGPLGALDRELVRRDRGAHGHGWVHGVRRAGSLGASVVLVGVVLIIPIVLVGLTGLACTAEPKPQRLNLVFVSLDTVRRDHLPTYGYERDTAPAVDALAQRSVVFWNAISQDTNTDPSHTSMFTGLYPPTHGSRANGDILRPGLVTLAEILRGRGYQTGGFVGGAPMTAEASGLDRGFEIYDDDIEDRRRDGAITTARALEWLDDLDSERPFFLFLHLWDAHGPYVPEGEYRGRFTSAEPGPVARVPLYQQVDADGVPIIQPAANDAGYTIGDREALESLNGYVDRYDDMIRYVDDLVGRVLAAIDLEHTVVVIVSDHGETLGERYHQLDHGAQAFDEQIRIPLLLAAPGERPGQVERQVETVDLLPTLVDLLVPGALEETPVQGQSLVPLWRDRAAKHRDVAFSSARADSQRFTDRGYELDAERRIYSVRTKRWKLIAYPGVDTEYLELYDVAADPGELNDLAQERPQLVESLLGILDRWHDSRDAPIPVPELSLELRQQLESLGYVD